MVGLSQTGSEGSKTLVAQASVLHAGMVEQYRSDDQPDQMALLCAVQRGVKPQATHHHAASSIALSQVGCTALQSSQ